MKKLCAILLAAAMLLAMTSAFADDVTLTLWSIATESDSSHQAFVDAIAEFEANHPGVKINHVATENEAYKTLIKAAMSSGENLPDIFFTWGMGFLGEFVNAGRVYCVDSEYEAYKAELPEPMTVNVRYDGKMYGVPYTMSLVTLYANLDILKEVGYDDIPGTYEAMIDCCDKLVAAGKIPFGVSFEGRFEWGGAEARIEAKGGRIREVRIYTDALDTELFRKMEEDLKGARYDRETLKRKAEEYREEEPPRAVLEMIVRQMQ